MELTLPVAQVLQRGSRFVVDITHPAVRNMELIFDKRSDANGALDILRLWAALQAGDDPCSLSLSRPLEVRCRGASSARSPGGFCGRVLQSGRLTLTLPNLTVATRAGTAGLWSAAGHAAAYNMGQYVPMVNPRGRWRCGRRGRRDRCHQLCGRRGSRGANKCGTDHRAPRHGANMGTAPGGGAARGRVHAGAAPRATAAAGTHTAQWRTAAPSRGWPGAGHRHARITAGQSSPGAGADQHVCVRAAPTGSSSSCRRGSACSPRRRRVGAVSWEGTAPGAACAGRASSGVSRH